MGVDVRLRMGEWAGGWSREGIVRWVGTRSVEISLDHVFEILKCGGFDAKLPLEVGAHLPLHLVDLPEDVHTLTDDTPRLVGVSVIADDLGSNHKGRDEESVSGGTARGDEARLESLQQVEGGKGHRRGESGAMEGVCDEMWEVWGGTAICWGWWLIRAVEEVVYVTSTHLRGFLMAVVGVLREGIGKGVKARREGRRTLVPRRAEEVGWGVLVEVEIGLLTI